MVQQPVADPDGATVEEETFHESDMRGALTNDSLTEDELQQLQDDRARAEAAAALRAEDYQLAYAIDILRGLSVLSPAAAPSTEQAAVAADSE